MYLNEAQITWDRSYSYDFDSYVLNLRWDQDGIWRSQVLDRNTNPQLAWQNLNDFTLNLSGTPRVYYLSVQAKDKHGNLSPAVKRSSSGNWAPTSLDLPPQGGWSGKPEFYR